MARRKTQVDSPVYYTTYQVAKFFGVSLPTVVNWVNSDWLPAHRTPGGHRRIAHNDLILFAREQQYPLSREVLDHCGTYYRVLVVDDERDFAEMVRDFLSRRGDFDVEIAESGFAAGLIVARLKPDMILLDIMMPGMDGFEVVKRLREDTETRHIPVIACTAYRDSDIERRAVEAGMAALVEKPLRLESLLELIQKHLPIETAV